MTNATDQLSDIKEVLIVAAKSAISRLGSVLVNEQEIIFSFLPCLSGDDGVFIYSITYRTEKKIFKKFCHPVFQVSLALGNKSVLLQNHDQKVHLTLISV